MLPATVHLTPLILVAEPTPMMEVVMVWVVERGMPKREAISMARAAPVSAAKMALAELVKSLDWRI